MSQKSKTEYIGKMRLRYQSRGREGKSRLLDEVVEVCDFSRKHAVKLMNLPVGSRVNRTETRGRKLTCGDAEREVLKVIWLAANQPRGKLPQPMTGVWPPHYEKEHGRLGNALRKRLGTISARSIDRLLAPVRVAGNRRRDSGAKPGTLIKSQIPIRTGNDDIEQPGYVEADTVAHCGNRLGGDFVWTLDLTDVHTQWTECRAVWNKGRHGVVSAIEGIEAALPFDLLGFDSGNGSEFLNWHLAHYLQERGEKPAVAFTRPRPYRKNDNARVEQKNWTHARQLLGHERLGDRECLDAFNDAYRDWCTLKNFFVPVMKLEEKTRVGGRYRKRYDRPKTPADRMLGWAGIDRGKAAWIRKQRREPNPFELRRRVEKSLGKAFEIVRRNFDEEADWLEEDAGAETAPAPPAASLIDPSPTAPGLFVQPQAERELTQP